jgi:AcrR family transcriptional regulator
MIDAVAELGFARASVAEVARRAGVSKGVVTYHFAVRDDLVGEVIADVLASMRDYLRPRLLAADPERFPDRFVAAYVTGWVGYYRAHARQVVALIRIHDGFRDESRRPHPAFGERAGEVAMVAQVLERGQARGVFGAFDASVMAAVIKAAVDDLLMRYIDEPGLDLEAYGSELVALFERATRPGPG